MKLEIKDLSGKQQGECDVPFEVIPNGRYTQAVHDTEVAAKALAPVLWRIKPWGSAA